ncbi:MAG: addiction module antidote protein [Elusimicrobiota bacterium]
MKKTKSYQESLIKALKNPQDAAEYLNAALEHGEKIMFLVALRNVAEAHGGMTKLSRSSKLNRSNLYKMMSEHGHPEIQSLHKVLESFGLKLFISVHDREKLKRAA